MIHPLLQGIPDESAAEAFSEFLTRDDTYGSLSRGPVQLFEHQSMILGIVGAYIEGTDSKTNDPVVRCQMAAFEPEYLRPLMRSYVSEMGGIQSTTQESFGDQLPEFRKFFMGEYVDSARREGLRLLGGFVLTQDVVTGDKIGGMFYPKRTVSDIAHFVRETFVQGMGDPEVGDEIREFINTSKGMQEHMRMDISSRGIGCIVLSQFLPEVGEVARRIEQMSPTAPPSPSRPLSRKLARKQQRHQR